MFHVCVCVLCVIVCLSLCFIRSFHSIQCNGIDLFIIYRVRCSPAIAYSTEFCCFWHNDRMFVHDMNKFHRETSEKWCSMHWSNRKREWKMLQVCVCVLFDDQNSVCSFFSFVFFGCSLAVVILSEPTTCSCSPFAYGTYMWTSKTSNQFSNERMFKHIVDLSDLIWIYFYVIYIDFNFMYLHRTVT